MLWTGEMQKPAGLSGSLPLSTTGSVSFTAKKRWLSPSRTEWRSWSGNLPPRRRRLKMLLMPSTVARHPVVALRCTSAAAGKPKPSASSARTRENRNDPRAGVAERGERRTAVVQRIARFQRRWSSAQRMDQGTAGGTQQDRRLLRAARELAASWHRSGASPGAAAVHGHYCYTRSSRRRLASGLL